jgi:hypothetical protein
MSVVLESRSTLNLDLLRKPVAGSRKTRKPNIILCVQPAETGHSVPVHEERVSPMRTMEDPVAKYANPHPGALCPHRIGGRLQECVFGRFTLVREPSESGGLTQ